MMEKLTDYAMMVVNNWFFLGIAMGLGAKAMWGGQIVSMASGVCCGVLIYMLVQQWVLR
jgi:hypothetical protein